MNKLAIIGIALSTVGSAYAQSTIIERDLNQTKVNTHSPISEAQLQQDLLRRQQLLQGGNQLQQQDIKRYTGRDLLENPRNLERLLLTSLIKQNVRVLPSLMSLYKLVPNGDQSLIDWGNAMLFRQTDMPRSIEGYQKLVNVFPANNFIRFQFAEALFLNQNFTAAKEEFKKLYKATDVSQSDIEIFDRYLAVINKKEGWNFSFGSTFLNDRNLSNSAKPGTTINVGPGVLTVGSRQKGQGISAWTGANRQWNTGSGKFVEFSANLSGKYYWNNHSYNDLNAYAGLGFGYANDRVNFTVTPNVQKRWYAGGADASPALKQHSSTYGVNIGLDYWINPSFKYVASYEVSYDRHDKANMAKLHDGATNSLTNTLMYYPNTKQFLALSLDLSDRNVKDRTNAYERIGLRVNWGQDWPFSFNTSSTIGVAHRLYKEKSFLGILQDNTEYSIRVSVLNKKVQYKGFVPKLTWSYNKTSSNIPLYSYSKNNVMLEIGRSF